MSTIKVDTIQKANGTSQIGIDKIGGVASAGIIAVIAEGGTNTTTLAQGLCKVWSRINGSSFASSNSFNQSTATDEGTGIYQVNMTNAYSANEGAHTTCSGAYHAINRSSGSASQIEIGTYGSGHSSADESRVFVLSHGDLA